MRSFEITFYLAGSLVSRTLHQGTRKGQACAFARMLMSVRKADSYIVEEI